MKINFKLPIPDGIANVLEAASTLKDLSLRQIMIEAINRKATNAKDKEFSTALAVFITALFDLIQAMKEK